ncbi:MAG: transcriptional repressor [Clostridia bacterium]
MSKYITEQRKVLTTLFKNNNHRTFSAAEVQQILSDKDVSISAIYRNLSEMEKEGLLCKVSEKNRQGTLYQYVDPEHCAGIIHFKCQSCDATYHLDRNISQMIMAVAKDAFSFQVNGSSAFLYGQCADCSQKLTNN